MGVLDFISNPSPYNSQQTVTNTAKSNLGTLAPTSTSDLPGGGTFWAGADGQVYVQGDQGTNAAGNWDDGSLEYWQNKGYTQIADPSRTMNGPVLGASTTNNTNPTISDPFAQYGGKAAYDAKVGEINVGKSNALNSANSSMDSGLRSGRSNILDFIGGATTKQQGIDQSRANAQFSLQEGKGDIMDMVGRGVRSGGVMLANKNAGSSGATGQIARAYGELGNREARDVGNQFALENQGIDLQQNELNTGFETQKRKIDEFKVGQAEEIAGTARNALAALEATRMGASLPQLFAIDQEVQAIKDATMAKLGELDSLLQTERGKINPAGQQQTMAKANEMRTAGTGGPQMFNFNTNAAQMQNAGPSVAGAELPIYSNMALNRRREV